MKHFFRPTAFKMAVVAGFVVVHVGGNLLHNRSLYGVGGKLFSNADPATMFLYTLPNLIVAPILPLRNFLIAGEKIIQIPFAFALYTLVYLVYFYSVSCSIALLIEKSKKGRPSPTR